MFRRALLFLSVAVLGSAALPALASSRVVAQKSIKGAYGTVFLIHTLSAHHQYQIEVRAPARERFGGYGVEHYVYVANRQLRTGFKSLTLAGSTPYTMTVNQPTSAKLSQWVLAVNLQINGGRGLTVRFIDTGRRS